MVLILQLQELMSHILTTKNLHPNMALVPVLEAQIKVMALQDQEHIE